MGGTCNTYGTEVHTVFWLEKPKGRDHSEDLGVDWKIILE